MTARSACLRAARYRLAWQARRRDAHPIANGWKICGRSRVVPELAADLGPSIEVARHAIRAALLFDDARNLRRRSIVRDLLLKEVVPAEPPRLRTYRTLAVSQLVAGSW